MEKLKHCIYIAEDQTLVRESIKTMLAFYPEFEVIGEAGDGMTAIREIKNSCPDLILMDLELRKLSGITAIRTIRKLFPKIKILVLTLDDNNDHVIEVFKLGVNGYCLKDVTREEFLVAIRNVLAGKPYISASLLNRIIDTYLNSTNKFIKGSVQQLSFRERDVLKLIGEGYSIREIANYLFISPRTVQTHRYNIMRKLDLHNTASLVKFAMDNGLVANKTSFS